MSLTTRQYKKAKRVIRLLNARTRGLITEREMEQELAYLEKKRPLPEGEKQ